MITLSSDFGSPYPAAMRGVLLQRTDARLVDVAHDLPRQDVRTAAFWLREVLPWFPAAVHLVVVDPGVGTDRAAIVVRAGEHALVGPDNGVLVPPTRALCARQGRPADGYECFAIDPGEPASSTFHGRDVFAPAAAAVHETGVDAIDERFEHTRDPIDLVLPTATLGDGRADGEVLAVDGFGNVITNVPGRYLADAVGTAIAVDGEVIPVVGAYGQAEPGTPVVTVGSHGNVELAVVRGRGDEAFGLTVGDAVRLELSLAGG